MFSDFLNLVNTENADTLQHASDLPELQRLHMGHFDLDPEPYLPKASALYDNAYDLIPTTNDTIEELLAKAQRVGNVIEEGASLALTTNKVLTLNGGKTPEQIAISLMLDDQRRAYEMWKTGDSSLPPIDVEKSRIPSTSMGGKSATERNTRGEAMRRLYKLGNLDEEHYLWFVNTAPSYLIPLINAVMKLIKAERNANQGDDTITPLDLQELQTINKIVSVFGSRQKEISKYRVGFVNRAIHRVVSLATARREAIKSNRKKGITQTATSRARELFLGKRPEGHQGYVRKGQVLRSACSRTSRTNEGSGN